MKVRFSLYRLGQWLSCHLPETLTWRMAEHLSDRHWRRSRADGMVVSRNLSLALGAPIHADSWMVREVFRNFGRYFIEFFNGHRTQPFTVHVEGREHLDAAHRQSHGVIILSAHLGNWELLGTMIVRHLKYPLSAVVLPHDDLRVDGLFNRHRERCGVRVIPLGVRATAQCLRVLRGGGCLGLVGDRAFGETGMPVSLFGQRVRLPRGPALLSLRTSAPLVPMFMLREGRWTFRIWIERPIWPSEAAGKTHEARILDLMQRYASVLERFVRRVPTQWLLFQPLVQAEPVPPLREGVAASLSGRSEHLP